MKLIFAVILLVSHFSLDEIILDIYNAATELTGVDFEQLQNDLYALHEAPIDLNNTSDEELQQLYFLSPQQIDDILSYADRHPFESLYELKLIPSLADYEIRDLLPFVHVGKSPPDRTLYAREVFAHAKHEVLARVDARNIEGAKDSDPVFAQTRYRFDYQRRVTFGMQLRRPTGGGAGDLQYGGYLQLRDIGCMHTLVAGNFQASFGQGLVLAPVFHSGKSAYVQSVGMQTEGLRYYSSVDGEGLHGAGVTFRHVFNSHTCLDISALYSLKHTNDSTWHHLVGVHLSLRHKRLHAGVTAIENIWSDSIHPYRNARYNRHYFRGRNQAVIGADIRYNHGWFDIFAEAATTQNYESSPITGNLSFRTPHWGFGTLVGSRFYPTDGVALTALYRYYSPFFDNALGYAYSETSRLGDENGGYIGFDITRLRNWRFSGYGDLFYFSGYKYGLGNDTCTLGFDVMAEAQYHASEWWTALRLRAKKKGDKNTCSARFQFDWQHDGWSLRTTVDANYVQLYGLSAAQDVSYDFQHLRPTLPLSLRLRLQGFDAREWDNRIYLYEHDVLYAFSIPATYGLGGRAYLCLRWQIIRPLTLYFRISETVYNARWAAEHVRPSTRTDIHLLLRLSL